MSKIIDSEQLDAIFKEAFVDGVGAGELSEKYGSSQSHMYRILQAQIRRKETLPLLARYRPSWIQKEIDMLKKLIEEQAPCKQ